jgi:sugar phosphate isomerase/epimerase
MGDYSLNFYEGAKYGLEPSTSGKYAEGSLSPFVGYKLPMGTFGVTTDPRTANQIKAVSDKISTGAKAVEITGIDTNVLEYMPQTHMKEIARLKELAGVELTFHGPLVEPTGVGRNRWEEQQREHAERQMWSALERSQELNKKGNTIVTFHSSNGLPEPVTTEKIKGKEVVTSLAVINERTGELGPLPKTGKDYWKGEEVYNPYTDLERINQENWNQRISNLNIEAIRASEVIQDPLEKLEEKSEETTKLRESIFKAYEYSKDKPEMYEKFLSAYDDKEQRIINSFVTKFAYGKGYVQDAYLGLQKAYNDAYEVAKRQGNQEAQERLKSFKEKIAPLTQKYENDPLKLAEFSEEVSKGIRLLNSVKAPETYRPLRDFAVEKASETFGNLAFKSYEKFHENSPIISIENPPVGMGLTRADDLKELVEKSQDHFVGKAQKEFGWSEERARQEAKKLIGVTWDVGHINMLRKHGFDTKDITEETRKIKEHVKHIHLSDNFGLEHTELPMGMGNVQIKEHEKILSQQFGEQFKKIKQVVETGGWYQHFKTTPLAETFEAFGSALYPMKMASYWNATRGAGAGYFAGYGNMLPDINFSTYGAGFSSLPKELGGQVTSARNRLSGAPME